MRATWGLQIHTSDPEKILECRLITNPGPWDTRAVKG